MSWIYNDRPVTENDIEDQYGFVYEITNLLNGKRYIGKKLLWFSKTKTVKGKKKRYKVESDWKTYWGSNKQLLLDIAQYGEENFIRTVLYWCKNKGEANYMEAKIQFEKGVLLDENFYNDLIRVRVSGSHVRNVKKNSTEIGP